MAAGAAFIVCCLVHQLTFDYLRAEAEELAGWVRALMADCRRRAIGGRVYLSPTADMESVACSASPEDVPETDLPAKALGFRVQE